jgi:hypothetical protein
MFDEALKKRDWKEAAAKLGLAVLIAAFGPQAVEAVRTVVHAARVLKKKRLASVSAPSPSGYRS